MAALIPSASATGSGTMTLAGPSTNSNQTVTIPDATGTMMLNGPAFSAYNNTGQTISTATNTKISFQTEEYDTANCFDSTTNYRFTPNVAGYYLVAGGIYCSTSNSIFLSVYKNGGGARTIYNAISNGAYGSTMIYMNGTTDYLELICSLSVGQTIASGNQFGWFQAAMVRSA